MSGCEMKLGLSALAASRRRAYGAWCYSPDIMGSGRCSLSLAG